MPLISIIVPIYNSENTLHRCIDSILRQTFCDWELLLIDDGSTDKSSEICDEYAKKNIYIKVFHKENGGVSSARNVGLENAEGDWITFVDSDDWVTERYLENLYSHVRYNIDLIISYAEIYSDNGIRKELYPSKLVDETNFESIFIENNMHWHTSPWSKLYKRCIIEYNNIRFIQGMQIGEDALFLYTYMLYSKKIFVSSDTDYCYFLDAENSLTKRINDLDSEVFVYKRVSEIIEKLISVKKITSKYALMNFEWLRASYQIRLLNALYFNDNKRKFRLNFLEENDWSDLINNLKRGTKGGLLTSLLFKLKLWRLYDTMRLINKTLKYLI